MILTVNTDRSYKIGPKVKCRYKEKISSSKCPICGRKVKKIEKKLITYKRCTEIDYQAISSLMK